jgi:stearoyl-CoA desaturase (delta-9 desaturase)
MSFPVVAEKGPQKSVRKIIWKNLLFFIGTTSFGVFGTAIYLYYFGISLPEVLLFVFYTMATSFSITIGYHRLFSHASFKAKTIVRFLVLFFGAASFEQSALTWSSPSIHLPGQYFIQN